MRTFILYIASFFFLWFQAYMSQYNFAVNVVFLAMALLIIWAFEDYISSYDLPASLKWWIALMLIGSTGIFMADAIMRNKLVVSPDGRVHIKHPFYPMTDHDYASGSGHIDTLSLTVGYINDDGDIRPDKRTCYWLQDTAGYSTMYFDSFHIIRHKNITLWKKEMGNGVVHFIKYIDECSSTKTVDLFEVKIDKNYKPHIVHIYDVDSPNL